MAAKKASRGVSRISGSAAGFSASSGKAGALAGLAAAACPFARLPLAWREHMSWKAATQLLHVDHRRARAHDKYDRLQPGTSMSAMSSF